MQNGAVIVVMLNTVQLYVLSNVKNGKQCLSADFINFYTNKEALVILLQLQ